MTFLGDRDGDGDGTDKQTDGGTDIWTDRLFSENIILDLRIYFDQNQILKELLLLLYPQVNCVRLCKITV